MKKQFNRRSPDSRPRKGGKNDRGPKPEWKKRDGNAGQRSSGPPRRDDDRRKEGGEKREWKRDDNRAPRPGRGYKPRREDDRGERRDWKKPDGPREQKGGTGRYDRRRGDERKTGPGEKREWKGSDSRGYQGGNRYGARRGYYKKKEDNIKKGFDRTDTPAPKPAEQTAASGEGLIRLNKYLANAGICSRRDADKYIEAGTVTVNGKIITQLGYKISPGDKVQFGGAGVKKEKTVYILLNKPKGYITTTDDERDRATVLDLIEGVPERIYPIGRLDRNTSGLLLLTNDGDLTKILMHPKYLVAKVYHVELDKPLQAEDFEKVQNGIELEDGFIKPDDIAYVEGSTSRKEVGIEIHSGRNRIVRRIFEHLGYRVEKLDRVLYAGLTKKGLSRGKWRFLAENEVRLLKKIK